MSSQKYGVGIQNRDPGSRKNLFRIPDPGVKKAPYPGSATLAYTVSSGCSRQLTAREGTCIKFASAGDRTQVACVTGGHST